MPHQAYKSKSAAKLVKKETTSLLKKDNLKAVFTRPKNLISPRSFRLCTLIGVDIPITDNGGYYSYKDFAEQFFDAVSSNNNSEYFYLGVERSEGAKLVTTDRLEPWSVSKSVGIIYIAERDVLNMFIATGKSMDVGLFASELTKLAVETMENEVSLYSTYQQNDIHDVTVTTKDGRASHTINNVYALPAMTGNSTKQSFEGEASLIDDAVMSARNELLSKVSN